VAEVTAGWPGIIAEAGFGPAAPGLAGTALILNNATLGQLGTGTLAGGTVWTSLGGYTGDTPVIQAVSVTRTSTRQQGPLVTYEAGTASITLSNSDGRFSPENLSGPYVAGGQTQIRPMVPVRVRAAWAGVTYDLYSGYVRSWTPPTAQNGPDYDYTTVQATDGFAVLEGVTIPAAGSALGTGELSGARIARILAAAGWYDPAQGLSVIGAGQSALQGTTFGGTALSLLRTAADSEIGDLYVSGSGQLVFRDRHAPLTEARSNTVQAVFGDQPGTVHPAGTELPYTEITRPDDDTTMANDIQATIDGSSNMQEAKDATAIGRFLFPRTYPRSDLILANDSDALSWAGYVLAISKNDESRFDSLTLQADAAPDDLFPQALGRELGDRIQVWRRPPQGSGLPYSSASVTSPGTFANILFLNVAPGTYTVSWTVTLSGAAGAGDANNFRIVNGVTVIANSVNAGAPGIYPQAPQTFTVTAGNPDIQIGTAGSTPTTGAVYGAAIPSPIVKDCFIRSITHEVTVDGWVTTWGLQDAGRYSFMVLNNATLGQLGANALAF
jgi:hypothetical protein